MKDSVSMNSYCIYLHNTSRAQMYFYNKIGYIDRVTKVLKAQGFEVEVFIDTHVDPDMECIRKGVEACNRFKPDLMICLGGGSPMDAGKFIRALYEHPELTLDQAA